MGKRGKGRRTKMNDRKGKERGVGGSEEKIRKVGWAKHGKERKDSVADRVEMRLDIMNQCMNQCMY